MLRTGLALVQKHSAAALAALVMAAVACGGSGCAAVGGAIENYRRSSTKSVDAEYTGLAGKSFAVVVSVDRSVQSDYPTLVEELTRRVTDRLSASTNEPRAGGFVPSNDVIKYQYNRPGWAALPPSELAEALGGVDRLIFIELYEFRLNDPGNQYLWDGVAAGTVAVAETDSPLPDVYVFEKTVQIKFPDQGGYGPNEMNASLVGSVLIQRFVDRSTWLFYTHEEPYYPDY